MAEDAFTLAVESMVGPGDEPVPRRFRLGARTIEVVEILDRWPGADHLYVKLRGDDEALYILRHDLVRGTWQLVLFERAAAAQAPAHSSKW